MQYTLTDSSGLPPTQCQLKVFDPHQLELLNIPNAASALGENDLPLKVSMHKPGFYHFVVIAKDGDRVFHKNLSFKPAFPRNASPFRPAPAVGFAMQYPPVKGGSMGGVIPANFTPALKTFKEQLQRVLDPKNPSRAKGYFPLGYANTKASFARDRMHYVYVPGFRWMKPLIFFFIGHGLGGELVLKELWGKAVWFNGTNTKEWDEMTDLQPSDFWSLLWGKKPRTKWRPKGVDEEAQIYGRGNLRHVWLAVFAGCYTAKGKNSIAEVAHLLGARTTIGFRKAPSPDEVKRWAQNFWRLATKGDGKGALSVKKAARKAYWWVWWRRGGKIFGDEKLTLFEPFRRE